MDTLKKAGAMLAHLDLFHSMLDLRRLLQLAAHMKERGDRAMLISEAEITLIGAEPMSGPEIVTSKGERIDAPTAYRVLGKLEGYEAPEYAVNREALAALNARAVAELENSEALAAFGETLTRIGAGADAPASERPERAAAERPTQERGSRARRTPDAEEAPTSETAPTNDSAPAA
ncbi:multidrug DMT transporter [Deinococcus sp. VB343]|uniref:Multidrug DMT transporter n=1 Tax=Deinococcus sp. VB142 TaxID=3112952 RepID=A0AAU6Q5B5_9DEIO